MVAVDVSLYGWLPDICFTCGVHGLDASALFSV